RVSLLNSGFKEVAADGVIALSAAGLRDFEGDAADRLIAATSVVSEARLVTADPRFIGFRGIRTMNATT
ncbi:MAG: hypothetical protein O3B72_07995, partial [Proteobacteria bacterium]|nr:hypothetical protein [Pseudomonadota bacterium]